MQLNKNKLNLFQKVFIVSLQRMMEGNSCPETDQKPSVKFESGQKRITVAERLKKKNCDATSEGSSTQIDEDGKKGEGGRTRPNNGKRPQEVHEHSKNDGKRRGSHNNRNGKQNQQHGENGARKGLGRGCGGIPDRWLQYQIAIGQPMDGTRFLAFKTPLGPIYFNGKEFKGQEEQRFEVETVIGHVNSLDKTLGLVIDLTNTDRYYNYKLWDDHKVKYVKIRCPGHEVNGDDEFYQRFRREVQEFMDEPENDDKLIGVHCTHGLNRTGYLICRYLIEELGWKADMAIERFGEARRYPMERLSYIESLREAEKRLAQLNVGEKGE